MAALLVFTFVSWVGSFGQATDGVASQRASAPKPDAIQHHPHDCCEHRRTFPTAALPAQPAGMPCGNERSCCVRPGPQNVPNLPSACSQQLLSEESRIPAAAASAPGELRVPFGGDDPLTFLDYSVFNTILRI